MTERGAAIVGLVASSAIPPLFLAVLALPTEPGILTAGLVEALLFVATAFLVFLPYSMLFALLLGLPSYLLCRRFDLVTWWTALAAGALIGLLVSISVRPDSESYADALLKYVPVATVSALAFWAVWKRLSHGPQRPDR